MAANKKKKKEFRNIPAGESFGEFEAMRPEIAETNARTRIIRLLKIEQENREK